jgi:hypothetical protein
MGTIIGDVESKKEQILSLYESGVRDIADIVRQVKARPSYVAQVLQQAGHLENYFDLYTTSPAEFGIYARFFRHVLLLGSEEEAREACKTLTRLYDYFERLGDRAGQHHACVVALTGRNRARWSGKPEVGEVYREWLESH